MLRAYQIVEPLALCSGIESLIGSSVGWYSMKPHITGRERADSDSVRVPQSREHVLP